MKNFAVLYVCDLDQVPDFKQMYELYDPVTLMFFFRNKHMMCDFGTGNNNKLNWVLEDKQELIDIIETIYRGAKKGRGLVVSPKGKWFRVDMFSSSASSASSPPSVGFLISLPKREKKPKINDKSNELANVTPSFISARQIIQPDIGTREDCMSSFEK